MVASLLLPISGSNINVKVHPVVLLQICDSYIRRGEKQDRVIGSLLGTVSEGTINVSRCFVVPHTESMDSVSKHVICNNHSLQLASASTFKASVLDCQINTLIIL